MTSGESIYSTEVSRFQSFKVSKAESFAPIGDYGSVLSRVTGIAEGQRLLRFIITQQQRTFRERKYTV